MVLVAMNHIFTGKIQIDYEGQAQTSHGKYKNQTVVLRPEIYAEKGNYGRYF